MVRLLPHLLLAAVLLLLAAGHAAALLLLVAAVGAVAGGAAHVLGAHHVKELLLVEAGLAAAALGALHRLVLDAVPVALRAQNGSGGGCGRSWDERPVRTCFRPSRLKDDSITEVGIRRFRQLIRIWAVALPPRGSGFELGTRGAQMCGKRARTCRMGNRWLHYSTPGSLC